MKKPLHLKKFKNEDQERDFWSKLNLADYVEAKDFESVSLPNLKPTSRSISIRIPEYILIRIKGQANAINIPYQTLMKQYITQGVFQK